ncbi:hypothetical protein Ancab_018444 [Ancistrocladus abbreviatus]
MGVPDNSLLDLIHKRKSLVSWTRVDSSSVCARAEFRMAENGWQICNECEVKLTEFCHKYNCRGCGKLLCGACVRSSGSLVIIAAAGGLNDDDQVERVIKSCKFCSKASKRHNEKIYPSESPRESPEPPPTSSGVEKICHDNNVKMINDDCGHTYEVLEHGFSSNVISSSSLTSAPGRLSPISVCHSPIRSDGEEAENSGRQFFSPSSDYYHNSSDIDISSISARRYHYSFRPGGSSPSDSPSRITINLPGVGHSVQQKKQRSPAPRHDDLFNQETAAVSVRTSSRDGFSDDPSIFENKDERFQEHLDFENNGHIWFSPPPEDEDDEVESNYFEYEDDDDDIGESGRMFSSTSSLSSLFPMKEKQNEEQKKPLRGAIRGHFRALVSQLLQGVGIAFCKEAGAENWLDIVSTLAWQAANFVKPDTNRGGSMDPGDYVKVKCIASGRPVESTFIKGIVCTKNIKHKRMTSQYRNPRLLLLGGSLEYQRVPNQLASFNTLLEEEMNHLKVIVSKIEAHRPNVLLVEKSVSSYAQEYLLAKEISLVLNVKRTLLERIARCTGALITPTVDNLHAARVGHCELFRVEKVCEELEIVNQFHKRPMKTLMFFEGFPRRLGCTVLLKGSCRAELKKVKHVIQYAVFAAYHLSLETSFLADEGATLPKMTRKPSVSEREMITADNVFTTVPRPVVVPFQAVDAPAYIEGNMQQSMEVVSLESPSEPFDSSVSDQVCADARAENVLIDECDSSISALAAESSFQIQCDDILGVSVCPDDIGNHLQSELGETVLQEQRQPGDSERNEENDISSEYFSAADSHQSILVSFSSRCVLKGTVCERSRLLRIKFYGSFDKPLGRYLCHDLFDQASYCRSCKEPVEAHVQCYTHQQGSLTINVRRLSSQKLPGEQDGKIWMWHRCLKCAHIDGVPPATRRVVMSDAAWGLSFGKFLELSFSNHSTANRVANCGHSLQRDCLRFYGFGSMVAFFHYSPIEILSVRLPPSILEFNGHNKQEWMTKEAVELKSKVETLYAEIAVILHSVEQKVAALEHGSSDSSDFYEHIAELKDLLDKEMNDLYGLLQYVVGETSQSFQGSVDILELNRLRRLLLIGSRVWDHRLYSLDSQLRSRGSSFGGAQDASFLTELKDLRSDSSFKDTKSDSYQAENVSESPKVEDSSPCSLLPQQGAASFELHLPVDCNLDLFQHVQQEEIYADGETTDNEKFSESMPSPASSLSDKIDSAWTGTDQHPKRNDLLPLQSDVPPAGCTRLVNPVNNHLPFGRLMAPMRVYSFDSATRLQERLHKRLPPSALHFSAVRSFHASGDYRSMLRDTVSILRTCSQSSVDDAQNLSFLLSSSPLYTSSAAQMAEEARLLLPQTGRNNLVIAVYDDEPTSIISYALTSKEHEDWISCKMNEHEASNSNREEYAASNLSPWQSFGSLDLDYINYGSYGSEDASSRIGSLFTDSKKSPHLRVSFGDESSSASGKAKFSVTCYFAKQFDMLRKRCCPSEVDFVCSLSRCRKWSAQGGKSNVYFAKSMDERFIIKQVTKTELDSFEEFGPGYFKYLMDSLNSGSPTCLAKILGIYQVTVKHLRGGKETKMDLMVMENLFFKRSISKVYDLKGSLRSRYVSDSTGTNKVLQDMNLLETLRTKPIFLGSKAKRSLERAVWNDTSFLASVGVMDYSLLVGVDEERKELVLGIIDFMRQYTWDKHLETWVKASGILGGPRNSSPTIISPKQYKIRFRKAMTAYFLTVPDQWLS